jgi:hypothetical protein
LRSPPLTHLLSLFQSTILRIHHGENNCVLLLSYS